jgi:hypothetical protein
MRLMGWLQANGEEEVFHRIWDAATRPNGSLNVSKLHALAVETIRPIFIEKMKDNPDWLDKPDP